MKLMLATLDLLVLAVCLCKAVLQSEAVSMLGLCLDDDPSCTELAENETCDHRNSAQAARFNSEICSSLDSHQTIWNRQDCPFTALTDGLDNIDEPDGCPQTISQTDEWPVLNYTMTHRDSDTFLVTIHWELSPGVTFSGYSLFITRAAWTYGQSIEHSEVVCGGIDIPGTSTEFTYPHDYSSSGSAKTNSLYIKLIPHDWCDGPQVNVLVPQSCYSLCPGACNVCMDDNYPPDRPDPPDSLTLSLCHNPDTNTSVAHVEWESKQTYFSSYPNKTYYVAVYRGIKPDIKQVSRFIEVVGKTSVLLHNLTLLPGQTYELRVRSFDCKCGKIAKHKFDLDTNQLCPTPVPTTPSSRMTVSTSPFPSPSLPVSSENSHTTLLNTQSAVTEQTHFTTPAQSSAIHPHSNSVITTTSVIHIHSNSTTTTTISTISIPLQTSPPTNSTASISSTNSSPLPTIPSITQQQNNLILFLLTFVAIAASFLLFTVIITVCFLRHHRSTLHLHKETKTPICVTPCKTEVLLVYSLSTPDEDVEHVLENFVQPLRLYGVCVLFYDMLYGQVGIPQWMESSITQSTKVFLLYNSQFKHEWEGSAVSSLEGNLVHILKQNFAAHVSMSSDYMSKYALLLPKADCEKSPITSNYLYNLQRFVVDPQDPAKLEQTVKFIKNCKSYSFADPEE